MNDRAPILVISADLLAKLDPEGKLNTSACLQCGRCSSGCTMRQEADILPHQINRMVVLGLESDLLSSKAIWTCASCHTCVSRCPMHVDTPALIDRLRAIAAETRAEDVQRIRVFNRIMLASMRRFGRVYEFGLMGEYKLKTRDFFRDLANFPSMLLKGKMKLIPHSSGGRREVRSIFDKANSRRVR